MRQNGEMHRLALIALLAGPGSADAPPSVVRTGPAFRFFVEGFWLNLHQFLYVLGRAEGNARDRERRAVAGAPADQDRGLAGLTPEEQRRWSEAVAFYASGPSKLDAVFDGPLIEAGNTLAAAGSVPSLDTSLLEPLHRAALEQAAPAYRKAWWPAHRAANQAWVEATVPLLDRHGADVLAFVTRVYGLPWPSGGHPVRVSAYANWAGAFSTRGELIVVSSLDAGNRGLAGLEMTFHEAMHQWDDPVYAMLREAARKERKVVPEALSHAMIFFTAGEAVRRAVPGHVPYAETNGLWRGRMGVFRPALESAWRPYLEGKGTLEATLGELMRRTGEEPRR
jgi:hypothetical protein